jgi:hypothetical protein
VRYHFGDRTNGLPPYIPQGIQSVLLDGSNERADKDIRLLSLKLGAPDAALRDNAAADWIEASQFTRFIYTNKTLYLVGLDGDLQAVRQPPDPSKPALVLAHANRYYYVSCGLLFIGFLTLNSRMRRQTKHIESVKGNT